MLTVNRLHGEIKRIFAENPGAKPSHVISALKRYVSLTLADERVFATAIALDVSASTGEVAYCNPGHPPMLIRRASGKIDESESTAAMLGVLPAAAFEADLQTVRLGTAHVLIAYTDGAIETANERGEQFGLERLKQALTDVSGERLPLSRVAAHLLASVSAYRYGAAQDDTLILALLRAKWTAADRISP